MRAFCTTFEITSSTTRSNGVSCPTCRFPVIRKATSRKAYTTTERSTFSATETLGTKMSIMAT
ncbi:MAG: hypothetical protein AUH30_18300 [Candidatus Rokubacteria bacterium 13_1_40CM_68_15]|nr:MAG: hypothetical protein AUH30_18300 [Candidatus Rokubacteria bacterium 13_1_40CM_68_15]